MKWLDIKINPVMRSFFLTQSAYAMGHGFVMPLIAIFASTQLIDGNINTASIASGILFITLGFAGLLGGSVLDNLAKRKREVFLFYGYILRNILDALLMVSLIFAGMPWHLYAIQAGRGIVVGATQPFINVIQTKHADRGKEGIEWGITSFIFHVCSAITAFVAGLIVTHFGFYMLFILGAVMDLIAVYFAIKTLKKYRKITKSFAR